MSFNTEGTEGRAQRAQRRVGKGKGPAGDAPGLFCLGEGEFLFEGEGEVEDLVAYGDAQGELAGFGVADVPEFAGGFLAGGEIGGFQGDGMDGRGFVAGGEIVTNEGAVVGDGDDLCRGARVENDGAGRWHGDVFAVHELVVGCAVG